MREIILSGCQNKCGMRPFYNKVQKQTAKNMMEKFEISNLSGRCYRELSGGQQQRVLLARALCATEKILLLDEPVAALDSKASKEMYKIIEKLNKEDNISIIMISHDIEDSVKYASHALYTGNKVFYGTKKEYEDRQYDIF